MTYSIEQIKKMLQSISPWPWHSDFIPHDSSERLCWGRFESADGDFFLNCAEDLSKTEDVLFIRDSPQIVSDLLKEVEYWQNLHTAAVEAQKLYFDDGVKYGKEQTLKELK